jgi:hypothetical protein
LNFLVAMRLHWGTP